jgi:putative membrane protein
MTIMDFPIINAVLNMISFILLIFGRIRIKNNNRIAHKRFMIAALCTSAFFLLFYTIYHANVGSVPYPYQDWTRPLYFIILVPHIILAAAMTPFVLLAVFYAFRTQFDKHRMIVVSGVAIYLMLYIL